MKNILTTFVIIIILLFGVNRINSAGLLITGEEEIPKPTIIKPVKSIFL